MKIQDKDIYHGAALAQIFEYPSFKALGKVDKKYGHYQINHNRRILIKHSSKEEGPWQFTFQDDDCDIIFNDMTSGYETFVCLVCSTTTVCLLDENEFGTIVDISNPEPQWVKVELPPRSRLRVRGSVGELMNPIPNNSFPKKLFESDKDENVEIVIGVLGKFGDVS